MPLKAQASYNHTLSKSISLLVKCRSEIQSGLGKAAVSDLSFKCFSKYGNAYVPGIPLPR